MIVNRSAVVVFTAAEFSAVSAINLHELLRSSSSGPICFHSCVSLLVEIIQTCENCRLSSTENCIPSFQFSSNLYLRSSEIASSMYVLERSGLYYRKFVQKALLIALILQSRCR